MGQRVVLLGERLSRELLHRKSSGIEIDPYPPEDSTRWFPQMNSIICQSKPSLRPFSIVEQATSQQTQPMTTANPTDRFVTLKLPNTLPCVLAICAMCLGAFGAERGKNQTPHTQHLYCSVGYESQECQQHLARLKGVLIHYPTGRLGDWTWIIVTSGEWGAWLGRLEIDRRSVAFSNMEQRTTVLEEALFLPRGTLTDKLAHDLQVRPDQLVPMAVGHELGHVLCRNASEEVANRVAEQLQNGKNPECNGNGRSLTRMEELIYEKSRALERLPRR